MVLDRVYVWPLKKHNKNGDERKTEHRECWGLSKRLIDENHKRKRVPRESRNRK